MLEPVSPLIMPPSTRLPATACLHGHAHIVELLVAREAALGLDPNRGCPLAVACRAGHAAIVERLLACPTISIGAGHPLPLHAACHSGNMVTPSGAIRRATHTSSLSAPLGGCGQGRGRFCITT